MPLPHTRTLPWAEAGVFPRLGANHVVHACAWSDGGAEFMFGDGSVLSFSEEMHTFVAIEPPGRSPTAGTSGHHPRLEETPPPPDMLFTAWAMEKYRGRVREALHLYNRYAPHPYLVAEWIQQAPAPWPGHSPLDALLLAKAPDLLERHPVRATILQTTLPSPSPSTLTSTSTAEETVVLGTEVTLWCALRRISLTLHVHRTTFSVRWPAPVHQATGARLERGRALASPGEALSLSSRPLFVWLEQTFPIGQPPAAWAAMLHLALEMDAETTTEITTETTTATADPPRRTTCLSLPATASSQPRRCRFSAMQPSHAHEFVAAASQWHHIARRHGLHAATARVLWRYDADGAGPEPGAMYWCLERPSSAAMDPVLRPWWTALAGATAEALVLALPREDESALATTAMGEDVVVRHRRPDGTLQVYHVSREGGISLPPTVGPLHLPLDRPAADRAAAAARWADATAIRSAYVATGGDGGARAAASAFDADLPRAPRGGVLGGRYLRPVGACSRSLLQGLLAGAREARGRDLAAPWATGGDPHGLPWAVSGPPAAWGAAAAEGAVVYLSRRLPEVGNFTALTNGTVRVHFDDRTLLLLLPGLPSAMAEADLVASCLYRDATRCTMRVSQCTVEHPVARYLAYALPFRRYVLAEAAGSSPRAPVDPGTRLAAPPASSRGGWGAAEASREVHPLGLSSISSCGAASSCATADPHDREVADEPLGLFLTSVEDVLQQRQLEVYNHHMAQQQRIQSILEGSDALGSVNRSLLCEDDGT